MGIWMPSVPFPYSGRVSPSGPAARAVYTQAVTVPPPTIGFGVRTSPSGLIEMFAVIGVPPVEAEIVAGDGNARAHQAAAGQGLVSADLDAAEYPGLYCDVELEEVC